MSKLRWLLTPASFLRLRSPELSAAQWKLPLALTLLLLVVFYALPVRPALTGEGGVIETINGLLNTLIGFYIAALAAIATFPSAILDSQMKGRAPVLSIKREGTKVDEALSRRRFLVILFGYAAFASLALFALGAASMIIAPSMTSLPGKNCLLLLWLAGYSFLASSLLVTTLLGLHYLIDRMHRE